MEGIFKIDSKKNVVLIEQYEDIFSTNVYCKTLHKSTFTSL